ncbi:MAG: phosphoglycerate mutase family protein [Massilibacteroides sp.]|nr:phosphoglycerate mutase family protein [Massilibacteroides sp.]MDD3061664.1 phosphoglycerate mutase family protein [Massilibacteroides sp.]MDD4114293.1 phosphoglycerate mutase family protein [Massilibacteroides sp.]MDD4659952.1 phosphoglycerate mutase family protein [Massilibacteroides sp.]
MKKTVALSEKNLQRAWKILRDTNVIEIWESIGATVHLIGSLKLGLMVKHCDIDLHIYSERLTIADSFTAIARLAEHPSVKRIDYTNLLDEKDACLEWHAWYEDEEGKMWHIDMIHIVKGSRYDGYFEKVAERISAVLTEETKNTILRLKYETPDNEKIMGIEYYRAVIEGGVRSFDAFMQYRKDNPVLDIVEWMP